MRKNLQTKQWVMVLLMAIGFLPTQGQFTYNLGNVGYTNYLVFNDPFMWAVPPLGNVTCGGYLEWPGVPNWNYCSPGGGITINQNCNIYDCNYNSPNSGQTGFAIYGLTIAAGTTNIDFTGASMPFSNPPAITVDFGAALNVSSYLDMVQLSNSGESTLSSNAYIIYNLENQNQLICQPASVVVADALINGNLFDNLPFLQNKGQLLVANDITNYAILQNLGKIDQLASNDTLRTSGTLVNDSVIKKPILVEDGLMGTPLVIFNNNDTIKSITSRTINPAKLTVNGTTNISGIAKLQNFNTTFYKQPGGLLGSLNILPSGNLQMVGAIILDIDPSDIPTTTDSFLLISGVGGNVTGTASNFSIANGSSAGWTLVKHQDSVFAKYTVATSLNVSNIRLHGIAKNNYNELAWSNLSQKSEAVLEKRIPNTSSFVSLCDAKNIESFKDYEIQNVLCEYRITCINNDGIVENSNSVIIKNTKDNAINGIIENGLLKIVSDVNTNAKIIDVSGNTVASITLTKGLNEINVSAFAQGLYIISANQINIRFRK
jgi:hypothetical protein